MDPAWPVPRKKPGGMMKTSSNVITYILRWAQTGVIGIGKRRWDHRADILSYNFVYHHLSAIFMLNCVLVSCYLKLGCSSYIVWAFKPFHCWGYSCPKHKDAKNFENHPNPVMLVFIGKISLSTLKWVFMWYGFSYHFLLHFILAKLTTSSIRVNIRLHPSTNPSAGFKVS